MEQFYIDRQFGQPIFVDVEKGIVVRCYNESETFNAKMNENYKGKTINFLNEDFIGRAMKGTYHHLRPLALTSAMAHVEAVKSWIANLNNLISSNTTREEDKPELRLKREENERELIAAKKKLDEEKQRILIEHNFNC